MAALRFVWYAAKVGVDALELRRKAYVVPSKRGDSSTLEPPTAFGHRRVTPRILRSALFPAARARYLGMFTRQPLTAFDDVLLVARLVYWKTCIHLADREDGSSARHCSDACNNKDKAQLELERHHCASRKYQYVVWTTLGFTVSLTLLTAERYVGAAQLWRWRQFFTLHLFCGRTFGQTRPLQCFTNLLTARVRLAVKLFARNRRHTTAPMLHSCSLGDSTTSAIHSLATS